MLSTDDRLRLGELKERLEQLDDEPFLSILSVDSPRLRDELTAWIRAVSRLETIVRPIDREHSFQDFLTDPDAGHSEVLALLDCLDVAEEDKKRVVSRFLFFRDELPLRRTKLILITTPSLFNGIITRAYDFYSFSVFNHSFSDQLAVVESHLEPKGESAAMGDLEEAENDLTEYRARSDGTPAILARKLFQTARRARKVSENDRALELYREYLSLGPEAKIDRQNRAAALGNSGSICSDKGDPGAALKQLREALEIDRQIGYQRGEAAQLGRIGQVHQYKGELDAALKHYQQALEINRRIRSQRGVATQLCNIGSIHRDRGDLDAALKHRREALDILRQIGHQKGVASALDNIGAIYRDKGKLDAALEHVQEALEIDRRTGCQQGVASALGNIGSIYRAKGEPDAALDLFREALEIDRQIGYQRGVATQLGNIGRIHKARGDRDSARKCLREALEIARAIQATSLVAELEEALAEK